MKTSELIQALRHPSAHSDPTTWDTLTEQAAKRLEEITGAWEAIDLGAQEFMQGSYGPLTTALQRAITGEDA